MKLLHLLKNICMWDKKPFDKIIIISLFCIFLWINAFSQKIVIIDNDSFYYSATKEDYIEKISVSDTNTLWMYYDYTGCADYFIDRNNRDSRFVFFMIFIQVPVLANIRSGDGIGNQRCNLCKCPYGARFNFKINRENRDKILKHFQGTLNLSLFGFYK